MTVEELLIAARRELSAAPFSPSRREANLLLANVLGWDEVSVLSRGERAVPARAARRFAGLLSRRLTGEPIAYLLGTREFFGRNFQVDSRVLIPRPETEHLIEVTLDARLPTRPRILDIGTGSGCIAVTLACELPGSHIVAIDCSLSALAVARSNIHRHAVADRVTLVAGDLARALDLGGFDLVVSNPPYIDSRESGGLSHEVTDFEPHGALFAPESGDSVIRRLLLELQELASGSLLALEIGHLQGKDLPALVTESCFETLELRADLAGIPRIAVTRRR